MAELPKSVREAACAAVLNAMLRADVERKPLFADDLADAVIAALLGACEVCEGWGWSWRWADGEGGRTIMPVGITETEVDRMMASSTRPVTKLRYLVITTAAEDITEEVGRG